MSEPLHVELRLTLRPEGMVAAVPPGRQALADTLAELLTPGGHEYITVEIQGHMFVLTTVERLHNVTGVPDAYHS